VLLLARRKVSAAGAVLAAAALSLACFLLDCPVALGSYLVFFVIGIAAAAADWRPSTGKVLASLGAIAILTAACLLSPWRGVLLVGAHPGPLAVFSPHANVVLALLTVPYAIYTTGQKGFRSDGMFADLSYVVYLLHWIATMWIYAHPGSPPYRFVSAGAAFAIVLGLSFIIWKFYDHPINRMRSRWVSGRKKNAFVPPDSAH
jgi:peptidoglycan/LPS O-acetylase OafA/YrhL